MVGTVASTAPERLTAECDRFIGVLEKIEPQIRHADRQSAARRVTPSAEDFAEILRHTAGIVHVLRRVASQALLPELKSA